MIKFQSLIGRLQTNRFLAAFTFRLRFQSLIGRLQTYKEVWMDIDYELFQSLIGRLQTGHPSIVSRAFPSFNPS